ncbi:MAG: ATP-dependent RNA helicase HrpA [Gammaproteobacteria bacterium]|nr:MAG: ATP-dependent RNA helicase HrpA [Gammaproteobacteria bacterium]
MFGKGATDEAIASLKRRIERSQAGLAARRAALPVPSYPVELPVAARRADIVAAIRDNPVVILCGETGSGKTTQLPKLCIEAGCGAAGLIGHTQPRRIAARSVAARIASELDTKVGEAVGFRIRFTDQVSDRTVIKLMTDGILLSEIQSDPWLNQYDTIIIDEAHERSLNIDFLLGYLKQLLARRPDLKLVITSATIDPERFARHFDDAPIILAEGRSWPVELRYLPDGRQADAGVCGDAGDRNAADDRVDGMTGDGAGGSGGERAGGDRASDKAGGSTGDNAGDDNEVEDLPGAITAACETLLRERAGDILVFLSGEREIREQAELLRKQAAHNKWFRGVEVLPLFSRLSNAEQNRIFESHRSTRIVLATNVAETSLTVPGIRAVVDPGLARVSRYSVRSKVQQLPIEKVSQASANQRKGRCGREAPGICIRLYTEEDFLARAEFTEPEILRTNLSAVILQMAAMKLGDIDRFPFVEPPEKRYVNDGYRVLEELAAMDAKRQLTPLGKRLARLPVDPRLGRMLLAAAEEGCVREMLTLVSALSIQDPRERPFDRREAADEMHAEFRHEASDFLSWLNLWAFVTVQKQRLSNSQFRKMCRQRFLSPIRLLEWMDVRRQLEQLARELKLPLSDVDAEADAIHRALLPGLLANVAVRTERGNYLGTRNRHLAIFPGSALFRKGPKWLVAAELAETSKLFARQVAGVDRDWIEHAAAHLLHYSYRDAHWQRKRGRVSAWAQSTLYGLVINPKLRVDYSRINPAEARQIFIREALVAGQIITRGEFHRYNQSLLDEVTLLEEKTRRRDIVVDPEELVRFYDALVPEGVCTTADFESWRRDYEREFPRGLFFTREQLIDDEEAAAPVADYPDQIDMNGVVLPLRYRFSPGDEDDGVTLVCPMELINRVSAERTEWLVPGLIEEKITALIKGLPKQLRRNFVPAPDYARALVEALEPTNEPLCTALSRQLRRMSGVEVPRDAWDTSVLLDHLVMRYEIIDGEGRVLAVGRDLAALQAQFADAVEESLLHFGDDSIERDAVTDWNFGDLPESMDIEKAGLTLKAYPALEARKDGTVGIRLFATSEAAAAAMPRGLRRLCQIMLRDDLRYLQRGLPDIDVLALRFAPVAGKEVLVNDIIDASFDEAFIREGDWPRTREDFMTRFEAGRQTLKDTAVTISAVLMQVFEQHRQVAKRLGGTDTGLARLRRLPVYFQAIGRRLDAIDRSPEKDRRRRAEFLPVWERFRKLPREREGDADYARERRELRWAFEELRVSLFAQELGTREKVSVSRLEQRVEAMARR